jgi:CubicO group peptidase (beta-lactamase class C family)
MKKAMIGCVFIMFNCITHAIAQTSLTETIDQLLTKEFKNNEPGGVVLVSKASEIIYKKAFGMANMELEVPMKDDMVFHIGSLTKQFTAVAILQLEEQGKLSINDTIGKYIAGCSAAVGAITGYRIHENKNRHCKRHY